MYEEKKDELEALEKELGERLKNLQKDIGKPHSRDSGEQAVERENDEVVEELIEETVQELSQVNNALKKIQVGSYGICEQCGKPINPERLAALPYSTFCIQCAK